MLIVSLHLSFAKSRGIKTVFIEQVFALLTAAIVSVCIRWTGLLVINSMLVLPAASARFVSRTSRRYLIVSELISLAGGIAGLCFSGLKSSVLQFTKRMERQGKTFDMADLACSFQECALDEIFSRVRAVLDDHKDIRHFVVGGGVSANSRLREKVEELRNEYPEVEFTVPPMYCCTDNASMIGVAGTIAYLSGRRGDASLTADSSLEIQ